MRGVDTFHPELRDQHGVNIQARIFATIAALTNFGYNQLAELLKQGKIELDKALQQLPNKVRRKVIQKAKNYAIQQFTNAVFNREPTNRMQAASAPQVTPPTPEPHQPASTGPTYDQSHRRPQPIDEPATFGPEYKGIAKHPIPSTTPGQTPGNHFLFYHGQSKQN